MRVWLAIRVFFAVLLSAERAARVQQAFAAEPPGQSERPTPSPRPARPKPASGSRSDALTLLAELHETAIATGRDIE